MLSINLSNCYIYPSLYNDPPYFKASLYNKYVFKEASLNEFYIIYNNIYIIYQLESSSSSYYYYECPFDIYS